MLKLTKHLSRSYHAIEAAEDVTERGMPNVLNPLEYRHGVHKGAEGLLVIRGCTKTDYAQVLEADSKLAPSETSFATPDRNANMSAQCMG